MKSNKNADLLATLPPYRFRRRPKAIQQVYREVDSDGLQLLRKNMHYNEQLLYLVKWHLPRHYQDNCQQIRLEKDRLTLFFEPQLSLTKLYFQQTEILKALQKQPECRHLKKVAFKHLPQPQTIAVSNKETNQSTSKAQLSQETLSVLKSWSQTTESAPLKKALAKILKN